MSNIHIISDCYKYPFEAAKKNQMKKTNGKLPNTEFPREICKLISLYLLPAWMPLYFGLLNKDTAMVVNTVGMCKIRPRVGCFSWPCDSSLDYMYIILYSYMCI